MTRKLASIQTIAKLQPIKNADRIEQAAVMGWSVVVRKGEFKVGDHCVFFEVDSILPARPWSEFLADKKYRIKTCKLRGVLSQGLALPLSITDSHGLRFEYRAGTDVTQLLGVTKYAPPTAEDSSPVAGPFPAGVPKTDELRIQSALYMLDELEGLPWYATVKLDGTSGTFVHMPGGEFTVCSHNNAVKENKKSPYWRVVDRYNLAKVIPEGFAVQGEVCGPKIQKNRLELEEVDLFVFDVFNIKEGRYLNFIELVYFCRQRELRTVRGVSVPSALFDSPTLDSLLELARGKYPGTVNDREGIVVRHSSGNARCKNGERLSFKVINNDFLLKDD